MRRPVRVLLVDDHDVMRRGLAMLLETDPDLTVVAEAADAVTAVAEVQRHSPDVVCMDVQMPGVNGLQATREVLAVAPTTSVLVLTTFDRDDYLFEAISAGASGFLVKNTPPQVLMDAIKVIADGEALLAPSATRRVLAQLRSPHPSESGNSVIGFSGSGLTPREIEVLERAALGESNVEIGQRLFIGPETVKTHVASLLRKLQLRDRIALVVWAHQHHGNS
jgi:DNA-binding NarL/FixJ family response regulator